MKVEITIKCIPESRQEAIDSFGSTYRTFRAAIETAQRAGQFPAGENVALRWLVQGGKWQDKPRGFGPMPISGEEEQQ